MHFFIDPLLQHYEIDTIAPFYSLRNWDDTYREDKQR